jgi:hypothetical protein
MQKIKKFQLTQVYTAPKSVKLYELVERNGHFLTFRVRNPKTRDSWKQTATSSYKADAIGAFEEVLLSDGTRLRGDMPCPGPKKAVQKAPITKEVINRLMAALDAA